MYHCTSPEGRSPHLSDVADVSPSSQDRVWQGWWQQCDLWCKSQFTAIVQPVQTWNGEKGRSGLKCRGNCSQSNMKRLSVNKNLVLRGLAWMAQRLITCIPRGEMCGFVKHFRKKMYWSLSPPSGNSTSTKRAKTAAYRSYLSSICYFCF